MARKTRPPLIPVRGGKRPDQPKGPTPPKVPPPAPPKHPVRSPTGNRRGG